MKNDVLDAAERIGWGRGSAVDYEILAYAGTRLPPADRARKERSFVDEAIVQQESAYQLARTARRERERHGMGLPHEFNRRAADAAAAAKAARLAMEIWDT